MQIQLEMLWHQILEQTKAMCDSLRPPDPICDRRSWRRPCLGQRDEKVWRMGGVLGHSVIWHKKLIREGEDKSTSLHYLEPVEIAVSINCSDPQNV